MFARYSIYYLQNVVYLYLHNLLLFCSPSYTQTHTHTTPPQETTSVAAAAYAHETDLSRRVSDWEAKIKPILDNEVCYILSGSPLPNDSTNHSLLYLNSFSDVLIAY